jgi:hypothetical protein
LASNDQAERGFYLGFDSMVAADARDPLVQMPVIRFRTPCDEDVRAM